MKLAFAFFVGIVVSFSSMGQSPYLNLKYDKVVKMLMQRGIEIAEMDSTHIHSVDDKNLRNMVFFFENDVCNRVITTFQLPEDYRKVINFLDVKFGYTNGMNWVIKTEEGIDSVTAARRAGFHFINESFTPNTIMRKKGLIIRHEN